MANYNAEAVKAAPTPAVIEQLEAVAAMTKELIENTAVLIERLRPVSHEEQLAAMSKAVGEDPLPQLPSVADSLRTIYCALRANNNEVVSATWRLAV